MRLGAAIVHQFENSTRNNAGRTTSNEGCRPGSRRSSSVVNVVQPIRLTPYSLPRITKRWRGKALQSNAFLEQVVQRGEAAVAGHGQTPHYSRVDHELA